MKNKTIENVGVGATPWSIEERPAYGDAMQIIDAAGYTVCEMADNSKSSRIMARLICDAMNGIDSVDLQDKENMYIENIEDEEAYAKKVQEEGK